MTHPNSTNPMTREALQELLATLLPGAVVELRDDTHKHLDHNEMVDHHGAHFFVKIVWDGFAGMPRLARHRRVHEALQKEWNDRQIHSLSLRLMTPEETAI